MASTSLYAIAFVQNVQLICFAVVFVAMYLGDRSSRSMRWFAAVFVAAFVGAVLQLSDSFLPAWLSRGVSYEGMLVAYGCLDNCLVEFVGHGRRTRYINIVLIAVSLPWFIAWSYTGQEGLSETLLQATLAVQIAAVIWVLLRSEEAETAWPQKLMASFLIVYALVETGRVAISLGVWAMSPGERHEFARVGGVADVVAISVLPLTFIWMLNRRLHARLESESLTDPVAGIYNRRGLQLAGQRELARYQRFGQGFAVVLLDIDHFKKLNDTFGHAVGDVVLRDVGTLLDKTLRESDTCGRYGGEEFVLLLTGTTPESAEFTAERLRAAIQTNVFLSGEAKISITASFGVTHSLDRKDLTWDRVLKEADVAMYTAKRDGRNCIRTYREVDAAIQIKSTASTYSVRGQAS